MTVEESEGSSTDGLAEAGVGSAEKEKGDGGRDKDEVLQIHAATMAAM
ncbi:MAG TPA: hypothetical protein VHO24_16130 [Opitutaceae bacterium]|nr:hypothetical protein [Opitutaceae bacterium]